MTSTQIAQEIDNLAAEVIDLLRAKNITLGTVESCTGGGLGAALTSVAGSSDVFMGGLITYSNALKTKLAGVPEELIKMHGAVSAEVAEAMAIGGKNLLNTDICISITGIAGPNGGTFKKPVGLVYVGVCTLKYSLALKFQFKYTSRKNIRNTSIINCLQHLLDNNTEINYAKF